MFLEFIRNPQQKDSLFCNFCPNLFTHMKDKEENQIIYCLLKDRNNQLMQFKVIYCMFCKNSPCETFSSSIVVY